MIISNVIGCYCNLSGSHKSELDGSDSLSNHVVVHTHFPSDELIFLLKITLCQFFIHMFLRTDKSHLIIQYFCLGMKIYDLGHFCKRNIFCLNCLSESVYVILPITVPTPINPEI